MALFIIALGIIAYIGYKAIINAPTYAETVEITEDEYEWCFSR